MTELDKLATDLFRKFARFEYALKAAGFVMQARDAKADWTRFANSIPTAFNEHSDPDIKAAVDYLENHPPRKQIVTNGLLEWDAGIPSTNVNTDRLLIYVRRVRNNLFHGGKFNGHWFEPQRSEKLLTHSIKILEGCLEESIDLRTAFHE